MRLNKNIFNPSNVPKGKTGYDDGRENIDPHIKTRVVRGNIFIVETADTVDPKICFQTSNTAHEICITLDESATDDHIDIQGKTAGVATRVHVMGPTGENGILGVAGNNSHVDRTDLIGESAGDFAIYNHTQDGDILFKFKDAAVTKTIQIDASANNVDFGDTSIQTTGTMLTGDHGTAATDQVVNVCYGTGAPPAANTTTIGALYIQYTA